jgi:tape measure domain-containing protein
MNTDSGRIYYSLGLDNTQLAQDANTSKNILHGISASAANDGERMDSTFKKLGATVASVFALSQLKNYAMQIVNVRGEFQKLEIAFKTMLGSADKADALMAQLVKTAATTPFGMTEIATAAKQLLAYGVQADKVNETLIRLGDIAAGLSIPMGDLAYLYGTTMTQGRLYTQDLHQFMGRGIPLADELAKQFGVTKEKVGELVTAGKVGFPEVEKAIESLTGTGSKFGGLMEAQSHTISGRISNISDNIEQMFNQIGQSSEGAIGKGLDAITYLVENWRTIGKVLLTVISTYGAYKAAVITVNAVMSLQKAITAEVALQQHLAAMSGIELSQAEALSATRTALFSGAMNTLKVAIMSNPIGLLAGVLAGVASAFMLFGGSEDDATEMSNKFGDSAAKVITRVNTLATTLSGLTPTSSTYKKVMEDLNSILEDYGLQAIKEGDSIDTINAKRQQAIELIKQEGAERQRANALETGADTYSKKLTDAQTQLQNDLASAMTGRDFGIFNFVTGNDELQKNSAAISAIVADVVEQNIMLIAGKTGDEYKKGVDKIYEIINQRMKAIGISEDTNVKEWLTDGFFNHQNLIQKYIESIQGAKEENMLFSQSIEKNAAAARNAASGTMTFQQKVDALQKSLLKPTDDVHTLYNNIKKIMEQYSNNIIGFKIKFDAEIPAWMKAKSIPELKRLAAFFAAVAQATPEKGSTNVNGVRYTKEQAGNQSVLYSQAAVNETDEEDKQKKAAQEKKDRASSAASRAESSRKQAEEERKRLENESYERSKQIKDYGIKVGEQTKQTELDIRQKQIDGMKDGFTKTQAQLQLNYDRLIAENNSREKEMLKDLADKKVLEWQNKHPKATEKQKDEYRATLKLTVADLTPEQQKQLKQYSDLAKEAQIRGNKEALNTMFQDCQTYEQQREKIAEEYAEKRKALYKTDNQGNYVLDSGGNKQLREGVTQGNVDELNLKEQEAYDTIDQQFAQREETYKAWCNQIANETLDSLKSLLEQAEEALKDLEKSGSGDSKSLSTARAKVSTLKKKVDEKQAQTDTAPKKRSIKEWEDLYKTLNECEKEFEEIGKAIGGVVGDIIAAAGEISASALSMVRGIIQLTTTSTEAVTDTSKTSSAALSTVEKASVILTIIAAAMQIAMKIISLFNSDKAKQKEIEALQTRIDQLQWELDNADAVRLQSRTVGALELLKKTYNDTTESVLKLHSVALKTTTDIERQEYVLTYKTEILAKTVDKVALAYANMSYTADKALGAEKYSDAQAQLKNIAEQQLLINEQINDEQSKKKTDKSKITDWENKIQELGEKAVSIINDMVEDIIGGSSDDIASQLGDAFFEAFQAGEDYAKAWGDKVNEIVADVMKRMLISKFLEEPLGEIFDKYKAKWFKDGNFVGLDAVIDSMSGFASDLKGVGTDFEAIWDNLPDSVKNMFTVTSDSEREASNKGIATASQESVDELNGRATAIQTHTYSISENTKLLLSTANMILQSVLNIEGNTDGLSARLSNVESNTKVIRDTVNDFALKGIKIA